MLAEGPILYRLSKVQTSRIQGVGRHVERKDTVLRARWEPHETPTKDISDPLTRERGKSCFSNRALVEVIFEAPKCL